MYGSEKVNAMTDDELDVNLAKFIAEIKKVNGSDYPGHTLYEIISSLQAQLRHGGKNITLIDKNGVTFRKLNSALNYHMKDATRAG